MCLFISTLVFYILMNNSASALKIIGLLLLFAVIIEIRQNPKNER